MLKMSNIIEINYPTTLLENYDEFHNNKEFIINKMKQDYCDKYNLSYNDIVVNIEDKQLIKQIVIKLHTN